ncbi:MAG: tetratricopeptide repeat protein, partial [Porticoccaceae bacterium]|nr:tetratricopeptide repeat protein [Porticoccaceae bacterium]
NDINKAKKYIASARGKGISNPTLDVLDRECGLHPNVIYPNSEEIDELLQVYRSKDFFEAEKLALLLVDNFPHYQIGWHILGLCLFNTSRPNEAVPALERAIATNPNVAAVYLDLARILSSLGILDKSEENYRKAIEYDGDVVDGDLELGMIIEKLGRIDEALVTYQKGISRRPDCPKLHARLGYILLDLNRLNEAEDAIKLAIKLDPNNLQILNNLGVVLVAAGRFKEAELVFRESISKDPISPKGHYCLGHLFEIQGKLHCALISIRQAVTLKPDDVTYVCSLANILIQLDEFEESEILLRNLISLDRSLALPFRLQGTLLEKQRKFKDAEISFRKAIELQPSSAPGYHSLGRALSHQRRFQEAEQCYRQAIELQPEITAFHSSLLFLLSSTHFNVKQYLKDTQVFSSNLRKNAGTQYLKWNSEKNPVRLRIGFVSGDFRAHPVGYFLENFLDHLKLCSVELYAYTTTAPSDELTERIRPCFVSWVDIWGMDEIGAAEKIYNDNLHILIDLSGHTGQNALPVFSLKPAPVQISWLGFWASTGLPEIDYVLGDMFVTPHNESGHFVEKIWQLPKSYLCFSAPKESLGVGNLPAKTNSMITFGCFNNLAKMTDKVISVRAKILLAVPDSKLFLKDIRLSDSAERDYIRSKFALYGVSSDRLILEGKSSRLEYLRSYDRVDISLAPFPYGGGTTSVEGLWMGVPVLVMSGDYFLSHLGESILHNVGLSDWIAVDAADYVRKAVRKSQDINELARLRKCMRQQLAESPLMDAKAFAHDFYGALRAIWVRSIHK